MVGKGFNLFDECAFRFVHMSPQVEEFAEHFTSFLAEHANCNNQNWCYANK